jgi:hypothetical protein
LYALTERYKFSVQVARSLAFNSILCSALRSLLLRDEYENGILSFTSLTVHSTVKLGTLFCYIIFAFFLGMLQALFKQAMAYVGKEFSDRISFYSDAWWPARSLVEDAYAKRFEVIGLRNKLRGNYGSDLMVNVFDCRSVAARCG